MLKLKLNLKQKVRDYLERGAGDQKEIERLRAEVERLRAELAEKEREGAESPRVRPESMLWIFGAGRTGSTWLRSMMTELLGYRLWEEPMVGLLFGGFYERAQEGQLGSRNFIMSHGTREGWIRSIRNFTLDGAAYAHPELKPEEYLVVKEPNSSSGAPLIMEALPESRMVMLLRDPRDVVASVLDGAREGSWLHESKQDAGWKRRALPERKPNVFVEQRSNAYMKQMGGAWQAYQQHQGPKSLVRYEDLVAEPLSTMRRLYAELGISVDDAELERAVEKHSWENIPEERKGEGKFYRKGTSGGWKEDLTSDQVEIVERVAAPIIEEFYPG